MLELGGQVLEMVANCGAGVGAGGQVLMLVDRYWSWWVGFGAGVGNWCTGIGAGGQLVGRCWELVGRCWC